MRRILSYDEYVARRIKNRKTKIRHDLGQEVIHTGKKRGARRDAFFRSSEGQRALAEAYERDEQLKNLVENRHPKGLRKEYEQYVLSMQGISRQQHLEEERKKLRENILKEIPANPIDLYPKTRQKHRHFILHVGPTNSGKTYQALQEYQQAETAIYLAPLRLLAYEVYEKTNRAGVPCNMITGEESLVIPGATHQASTIEMLSVHNEYDVAVIDEAQMIEDPDRGGGWTRAILGVNADIIHLCLAPYAKRLMIDLIKECGDTYEVIEHKRQTPLEMEEGHFRFPEDVRDNDALIVFSKRLVLACAAILQQQGINCSVIYGSLPYDVRTREVERFLNGENRVVVATDAIGMGMNLPIERIVFLENDKYDGESRRPLNAKEIQQIAGRAGRRGSFDIGYYTAQYEKKEIRDEYESVVPPIKKAVLKFPEELVSLDGLLSETLSQWDQMTNPGLYCKSNISREIALCKRLEKVTDDKELIYQFVTIPFNEKSAEVYGLWFRLFESEVAGFGTPLMEFLPELRENESLASLELKFQICDLANFYISRFGMEEDLPEILERKHEISDQMAAILAEQNLPVRKCEMCGRELAWNNPYRICNQCHDKRTLGGYVRSGEGFLRGGRSKGNSGRKHGRH